MTSGLLMDAPIKGEMSRLAASFTIQFCTEILLIGSVAMELSLR